jgi:acyl-homoserine-lactone acylase
MPRWRPGRPGRPAALAVAAVAALTVVLTAAGLAVWSGKPPTATTSVHVTGPGSAYHAVIRRTGYGIPHIQANDLGSAGFGQGWAYAEDRFCDLDEQIAMVRSQLSRSLGAGPGDVYLGSDLAVLDLRLMARARAQLPTLAPDVRTLLDGYAAGFDGYLRTTGAAHLPGWCAGQPWVTPVTATDLLAYQRYLAINDSGQGFLRAIVTAEPPGGGAPSGTAVRVPAAAVTAAARAVLDPAIHAGLGSNGWAIGGARSADGRGILVANPHYPWQGPLALWECQLTVPGLLNVYGASIGGLPGVQIGFNDHVAWTHTVSASAQYTLYSVRLVPGHPTEYLFGGKPVAMRAVHATVEVRGDNGKLSPFRHTMWDTRYGPVLNLSMMGGLGWTSTRAITYADADIGDGNMLAQWLHMDEAASLPQFQQVFRHYQAMPWLNTIAADDRGNSWYIDDSAVPDLSARAARAWAGSPGHLLNGSNPRNIWVRAPGARSPGLVPYADQPRLERRDYVFNANNSYWLASPSHPLTGFSPLYGPTGTAQSPRTRENAVVLGGLRHVNAAQAGQAILSERALTSDLLASGVVRACQARGRRPVPVAGTPVSLAAACHVLAGWDRRFTVSARGAVLWREIIASMVDAHPQALTRAGPLLRRGFEPGHPVTTPAGLTRDTTPVLQAMARAVRNMRRAKVALTAPLGAVQYTRKGHLRIPVPGSGSDTGILNVVDYLSPGLSLELPPANGQPLPGSALTTDGYAVDDGTSFLLAVGFTAHGPSARAILTFSESENPASPHYADQTRLFGTGRLRPVLFSAGAIASDHALQVEDVSQGP